MILLIDNYDSFTFNLYQLVAGFGAEVCVLRNDAKSVPELLALQASGVLLSPGPGRPSVAGVMPELLKALPAETALLGVCLGHQALVESHGGSLGIEEIPTHGKSSLVHHEGSRILNDLPNPFPAARYHSLRAERDELPEELRLTAWTEDGVVMAVEHTSLPRFGVQFHPESILTPLGERVIGNFLSIAGEAVSIR
jgi:anthranilate synthase component II